MKVFTCAACGNTYESDFPDEKAREEQMQNFPVETSRGDPDVIVCDECYTMLMCLKRINNANN